MDYMGDIYLWNMKNKTTFSIKPRSIKLKKQCLSKYFQNIPIVLSNHLHVPTIYNFSLNWPPVINSWQSNDA